MKFMSNEQLVIRVIKACKSLQKDRQALQAIDARFDKSEWGGLLGAGGIGVILFEVNRSFEFAQTCAVLLMLIVTVSLIDMVSSWLRQRFV